MLVGGASKKVGSGTNVKDSFKCDTASGYTSGSITSAVCTNGFLAIIHTCAKPGACVGLDVHVGV